jgi:hypothetical protein
MSGVWRREFTNLMIRADLSFNLIHLTRGHFSEAECSFRSIMSDRALRGSSRGIRGGHSVVCFSEAPVDILARMFGSIDDSFRYAPFGVMVRKDWLFAHGGRPAIYQPESEFDLLPPEIQYRHVRLDAPGGEKDFSFEREWRWSGSTLTLDPSNCTLLVPSREWVQRLRSEHDQRDMRLASVSGMNPFTRMTEYKWHLLAFSDLGAEFPDAPRPP